MTPKTLKEYGLEFINEMAKDREVAQQEIGVVISGTKSNLVSQGMKHFSYKEMDEFVKKLRKETTRIVDGELSRITIKSLGRIRQIIRSDTKFLEEITSSEVEDQLKKYEEELPKYRAQIKEKNSQLSQLEKERDENHLNVEKIKKTMNEQEMEIKRLQLQLQSTKEQDDLNRKRNEELSAELASRDAAIDKLRRNEKIHEKDIEDALASVAETYQIQDDYYARMLEEGIQQRLKQVRQDYDLEIEELQKQLRDEIKQHEESILHHKTTILRMEETITMSEDEIRDIKEKLTKVYDERSERNMVLDYTSRLLSTHPLYASILILMNLGGSLDLPTLAMSVGAHPLKIKQMMEDLVTKGLITISSDDPPIIQTVMEN
ncbi:MAG: hypothetical protein ACXAC8_15525 [Candidatus Hodarchaeales archaeon]|jgi:septal ring factor EnvC (AmiA/AmiB activator)